jgi:hypothetical protein
MAVTFDGSAKLIICQPGTTSLVVGDVYSRWKEWVATGANAKFQQAFAVIGGDPLVGGQFLGATYFLDGRFVHRKPTTPCP